MSHEVPTHLTRQYGRLLMMMRRLIKEEFGVTIRLEDKDAPEELIAFASRSRHHLLRDMMRELEELVGVTDNSDEPKENTDYYRGVPVAREKNDRPISAPRSTTAKRIYRGQVVN